MLLGKRGWEMFISICCGATHDERFHYDEENNEGVCVDCKEFAFFEDKDE